MGTFVDLKAADGLVFPAYVAQPEGTPKAGVVVLQEIFGVNAHIRSVADRYAADGYLAVAPATFHRAKKAVVLGYSEEDMAAGMALKTAVEALPAPGVMQDIQAAVHHAASAGKVGVVGFCYGGGIAHMLSTRVPDLTAAVSFYGNHPPVEDAARVKSPLLIHFAGIDERINAAWPAYEQALKAAHVRYAAHTYPGTQHGFNNDTTPRFDAAAAQLAWGRTQDFFKAHLLG